MKTHLVLALVGLAISFALPTFAQQKDTVDPKIAQQIRVLAAKFDEAFNKNDAAAVAALYTEDAFYGTPHGGFHGRQAIEEDYARHSFQNFHANSLFITVDRQLRSAMRYMRPEDGVQVINNGAAVLYKPTATVHGFLSVRATLGRSAGIPTT